MVDAGLLVFTAFIAPYKQSREYVRKLMSGWSYYEVYGNVLMKKNIVSLL